MLSPIEDILRGLSSNEDGPGVKAESPRGASIRPIDELTASCRFFENSGTSGTTFACP
jgi:hypothetical protein